MSEFQILLTNDDGIESPGLWAAAEALSALGYVHVVAPRQQQSGAGRGLPASSDGIIQAQQMTVHGKDWTVYSVGGSPAQTILYALFEIVPTRPHLVVSGINYGENVGSGITTSGTVGAALEAAGQGIPALAVSLETDLAYHFSHSRVVDFSAAAHFTRLFGQAALQNQLPPDVEVLKIDVPMQATPETPWEITRLSSLNYFEPLPAQRNSWAQPARLGYQFSPQALQDAPGTDVHALRVKRIVSVTPLSLDMTSRTDFQALARLLGKSDI